MIACAVRIVRVEVGLRAAARRSARRRAAWPSRSCRCRASRRTGRRGAPCRARSRCAACGRCAPGRPPGRRCAGGGGGRARARADHPSRALGRRRPRPCRGRRTTRAAAILPSLNVNMMKIGISPSMPLAAPRMRHAPVTTSLSPNSSSGADLDLELLPHRRPLRAGLADGVAARGRSSPRASGGRCGSRRPPCRGRTTLSTSPAFHISVSLRMRSALLMAKKMDRAPGLEAGSRACPPIFGSGQAGPRRTSGDA